MMDKKEIKDYFDIFCSKNKTEMTAYSYYFYYLNELTTRECNILVDKEYDAILPFYIYNGKYKFSYLPLIKDKIDDNYKTIVYRFIDLIKKIKGQLSNKILFVPDSIKEKLYTFKLIKTDESFIYNTEQFNDLSGKHKKNVRRGHNDFLKEHSKFKVVRLNKNHIDGIKILHKEWKQNAKMRYFRLFGGSAYNSWILNSLRDDIRQFNYVITDENDKVCGVQGLYEPYQDANRLDLFMLNYKHWEYSDIGKFFLVETYRDLFKNGELYTNAGGSNGAKNLYHFKEMCKPIKIIQNYSLVMW